MKNLEYYRRRLLQEEEAARSATSKEARECHKELAAAYRRRCNLALTAPESAGRLTAPPAKQFA